MPRRPVPATAQTLTFPAPINGMNTVALGTAMPPEECVAAWNVIPTESGLRARLGYVEWCVAVNGTTNNKVRSLISFTGSEPSLNRLFAVTDTYIYAASTSTTTPATEFTFASSSGDAGYGTFRVVVTPAGHFGIFCDEVNGLHVYTETGASWAAVPMGAGAGEIDNVDPADLVHATVFKRRTWFTERNTASAWYLGLDAIYGAATEFNFGTQFRQGGHLVGLYNWSYDGGAGMDDALVAISSGGDVVVCQGIDPSDPDSFNVRGTWSISPPPKGREIAYEVGGDLWILSGNGIIPISRLVMGSDKAFETAKIANLFNALMTTRRDDRGWSMRLHPEDNALLVLYPDYSTETSQCLAQSQSTRGWFRYRDLPMHCAAVWEGRLHFGTQDGRVCVVRDYFDNVDITDPDDYAKVDCTIIPAFQRAGGNRVAMKQIRALFLTNGTAPDVRLEARYDLDQSELSTPDPAATGGPGTWDNALWDDAVWGGTSTSTTVLQGALSVGHSVAAAVRFKPITRTTLVQIEAQVEPGGFL